MLKEAILHSSGHWLPSFSVSALCLLGPRSEAVGTGWDFRPTCYRKGLFNSEWLPGLAPCAVAACWHSKAHGPEGGNCPQKEICRSCWRLGCTMVDSNSGSSHTQKKSWCFESFQAGESRQRDWDRWLKPEWSECQMCLGWPEPATRGWWGQQKHLHWDPASAALWER